MAEVKYDSDIQFVTERLSPVNPTLGSRFDSSREGGSHNISEKKKFVGLSVHSPHAKAGYFTIGADAGYKRRGSLCGPIVSHAKKPVVKVDMNKKGDWDLGFTYSWS